jgi:hypothetical protein
LDALHKLKIDSPEDLEMALKFKSGIVKDKMWKNLASQVNILDFFHFLENLGRVKYILSNLAVWG